MEVFCNSSLGYQTMPIAEKGNDQSKFHNVCLPYALPGSIS